MAQAVSQVTAEVLRSALPAQARVSQVAEEVLRSAMPAQARVYQVVVEALWTNVPPPTPTAGTKRSFAVVAGG